MTEHITHTTKFDALEAEIKKLAANDDSRDALWNTLDYNGNGICSLAEIDKWAVERFPLLNHKPALMRAYQLTCGGEWVEPHQFKALLINLFYFNKVFTLFDEMDANHDHRLNLVEFKRGLKKMNISVTEADAAFRKIDTNHGGYILFDEFCIWAIAHENPELAPLKAFVRKQATKGNQGTGRALPLSPKGKAPEIHTKRFDALEIEMASLVKDKSKVDSLWQAADPNGNGICSFAEIDRLVKVKFPLLDHPRANLRAFKATCKEGDGDDWVDRTEFPNMLRNLFYFNKIYAVFQAIDKDHDNRLDFLEFKVGLRHIGLNLKLKDAEIEFKQIDKNGGGIILLDEFCLYIAEKKAVVD